jgi:hypothetical protein
VKKSLKKILIVALVASSGVVASGQAASAQAPKPVAKTISVVKLPTNQTTGETSTGFSVQAASGIRW